MSVEFDPRLTPARADLAARRLEGRVEAARFADADPHQVRAGTADLRRAPGEEASLDTQLLYGERFDVYEVKDGWAWGQSALDGYVGYVSAVALTQKLAPATHRVAALRSFVFPKADFKAPPLDVLGLNAKLAVQGTEGRFSRIAGGGFVFSGHLANIEDRADDYVTEAERFIGVPYLWGGKTGLGLDCSGLVQAAFERAGVSAPRDADMQERELGTALASAVEPDTLPGDLKRGDLIFWKGHVGIMVDGARMIHANATYMAVTVNNLREFATRVRESDGPVSSIKRL